MYETPVVVFRASGTMPVIQHQRPRDDDSAGWTDATRFGARAVALTTHTTHATEARIARRRG